MAVLSVREMVRQVANIATRISKQGDWTRSVSFLFRDVSTEQNNRSGTDTDQWQQDLETLVSSGAFDGRCYLTQQHFAPPRSF